MGNDRNKMEIYWLLAQAVFTMSYADRDKNFTIFKKEMFYNKEWMEIDELKLLN